VFNSDSDSNNKYFIPVKTLFLYEGIDFGISFRFMSDHKILRFNLWD